MSDNEKLWALFHRLWGRDKDNPGYVKQEWIDLEGYILRLCSQTTSSQKIASTGTNRAVGVDIP
jgi:hypothetical protein